MGAARWVLASVLLPVASTPAWADSARLNLHLEVTTARCLNLPQRDRFGFGVGLAARGDLKLFGPLAGQLGVGLVDFPPVHPELLDGRALWGGAGVRLRFLEGRSGGVSGEPSGGLWSALWVDAQLNVVGTGPYLRIGYEVGAGADLSLWSALQLGPFLRLVHIVQPDVPGFDPNQVLMLQLGLSVTLSVPPGESAQVPARPSAEPEVERAPVKKPPPSVITIDTIEIKRPTDTDGDGIPDTRDDCPNEPETFNGVDDDDGCPDVEKGEPLVVLSKSQLEIRPTLNFDEAGQLDRPSQAVLNTLARVLMLHPEFKKVRVETQEPSKKRAAAIRGYLVDTSGLQAARFEPESDVEAGEGRTRSVRVQLKVVEHD